MLTKINTLKNKYWFFFFKIKKEIYHAILTSSEIKYTGFQKCYIGDISLKKKSMCIKFAYVVNNESFCTKLQNEIIGAYIGSDS